MTLTDTLGAVCAYLNLPPAARTATLESKTNFLRPVRDGYASGVATCLHRGATTIVIETRVTDDQGRLVALTVQTQAVIPVESDRQAATAADLVQRYCVAWQDGDLAGLLACYAPEFTLHYGGSSELAGHHVGLDAALGALSEATRRTGRELIAIEDVLSSPTSAVLVVRERFRRGGEEAEVRRVLRYRIDGDRFTDCWLHDEDQTLVDRFWSQP